MRSGSLATAGNGNRVSYRTRRRAAGGLGASVAATTSMRATNSSGYTAPIGLTADPVVFTLLDGALCVLLARRLEEPQRGMFALPGGFVGAEESPEETAERKLREKTGVGPVHLEQLRTYADPRRDPRGWLPSIAYMALVRPETLPDERPPEREASWHPLAALPPLALDHAHIVDDGLWRLRARVGDKAWFVRKAAGLLEEPFTLRQAQRLYEALRREPIDAANFRRDVRATGLLSPTGELRSEGPGRPGRLFRRADGAASPAVAPTNLR
jgi:8-oxo-dGTP diphosphatase